MYCRWLFYSFFFDIQKRCAPLHQIDVADNYYYRHDLMPSKQKGYKIKFYTNLKKLNSTLKL